MNFIVGDRVRVLRGMPDPLGIMVAMPTEGEVVSIDDDGKVAVVGINGDGRRERFRTLPTNLEKVAEPPTPANPRSDGQDPDRR